MSGMWSNGTARDAQLVYDLLAQHFLLRELRVVSVADLPDDELVWVLSHQHIVHILISANDPISVRESGHRSRDNLGEMVSRWRRQTIAR